MRTLGRKSGGSDHDQLDRPVAEPVLDVVTAEIYLLRHTPYWNMRDFVASAGRRAIKAQDQEALYTKVREAALLHPTSGYQLLYHELRDQGAAIGLHKVRRALGDMQLNPPQPRTARKPSAKVTAPEDWPLGRRIHIDATRLSLPDGVCWVYFVLDVTSRAVLASRVVCSLPMHLAKLALDQGVQVLREQGVTGPMVVQSDAGSDFTSELFQQTCLQHGC